MSQTIESGVTRSREVQGQEQLSQVRETKDNKKYERVATPWLPQYLEKRLKQEDLKAIARFRCGNEEGWDRYWRPMEKTMCKECGRVRHDVEHIMEGCVEDERRAEKK